MTNLDIASLAQWAFPSQGFARRTITSPLDGSPIGDVPYCNADDVALAVETARSAQKSWAAWPVHHRARVADRFRSLILDHCEELLDIVHLENGKSRLHAFEEILDVALCSGYYARTAAKHLATRLRGGAIPVLTRTVERRVPEGLVGIISPWNYPFNLAVSDAVPALMAGNAVVLKPDSLTPFSALAAKALLVEAGLPADLLQVVCGSGAELGTPLIQASDHIMFTGSSATGASVAERCAARLIPCSAELGGKNPMLVLADANLEHTVEGAMQACFSTTGQLCVSIERIYVHQAIFDEFVNRFAERTRRLVVGTGNGWDIDLGPLISAEHLAKVQSHVDDAVAKGATVVAGGSARPDLGPLCFEPTILTDVTEDMLLARQETFGPVVAVYPVADDAEAIAKANDTEYGLNACVWSSSTRHAYAVAKQVRAGTVNINEGYAAAWASHDAPMGGMGISGLGRRHGADGIQRFTEPQNIAVQRWLLLAPPRGVPRDGYAAFMKLGGRILRRLPVDLPARLSTWWNEL
ncbi:MAG: succinic semialdehyde dehydrogenase [Propionibacteriaceae bacterium]|nr:succinic semialdehyde dehydrogenase [Propionibacteriaceae bacterium]